MGHITSRPGVRALLSLIVLALFFAVYSPAFAELVVGTQGGPWGQGKVMQRRADGEWIDLGEGVELGQAVMDIESFKGSLVVGTQSCSGYGGGRGVGRVWQYDGESAWTMIGELDNSVMVLGVMDDRLFAATNRHSIYRYEEVPGQWTRMAGNSSTSYCWGSGFRAGVVSDADGQQAWYLGELIRDTFWKFTPDGRLELQSNFWRSCVYGMNEIAGSVYAGCWYGSFYQYAAGGPYRTLRAGYGPHIWAVAGLNDQVFTGTGRASCWWGNNGNVGLNRWTGSAFETIWTSDTNRYSEGVTALVEDKENGVLFVGTGIADGYYSGDGVAELWAYDGETMERICASDAFGGGVQSMWSGTLEASLAIVEARLIPEELKPGDHALLLVRAQANGVSTGLANLALTMNGEPVELEGILEAREGGMLLIAAFSPDDLVLGREEVDLGGDTRIFGSAHSHGDALAKGSAWLQGSLSAVGTADIGGNRAEAEQGVESDSNPHVIPTPEQVWASLVDVTVIQGDLKLAARQVLEGTFWVLGKVHLSGQAVVRGTLIATGDIKVTGQASVTASQLGLALYTWDGNLDLNGRAPIRGIVVGNKVKIHGNTEVAHAR